MRVALFATCLVDGLFPDVGKATVRLLRRLGHEVVFPMSQTCCGQLLINTGYPREALPLIRNHVQTFLDYDAIVVPSGSCTASIRHQHETTAHEVGDVQLAEAAKIVGRHTFELSEFLVDVLEVTRGRRLLSAPGHVPPGVPRVARAQGRGTSAATASGGSWNRPRAAAGRAIMLRFRRNLRAEEPRRVDGDAGGQDERGVSIPERRSAPRTTPHALCTSAADYRG